MEEARRKDPDGKWTVFHDFNLAQMVIAAEAAVLNGNKIIPDFGFWHQLDPRRRWRSRLQPLRQH